MTFSILFSVSLLALNKNKAMVILCYAMLEGECLSSVITQAWKEVEERVLGFGNSVKTLIFTFRPHCGGPCSADPSAPAARACQHCPLRCHLLGEADLGDQGGKLQARDMDPQSPFPTLDLPHCIYPRCVTTLGGITWTCALTVLSAH